MGLLDDAIREHLELKRRRGADPAEITRLEQEALGPVRRSPDAAADDDVAPNGEHALAHEAHDGHDAPAELGEDEQTRVFAPADRGDDDGPAAEAPPEAAAPPAEHDAPAAAEQAFDEPPAEEPRAGAPAAADAAPAAPLPPSPAADAPPSDDEPPAPRDEAPADPRHSDIVDQPTTEFRVEDWDDGDGWEDARDTPPASPEQPAGEADEADDEPAGEDVLEETPDFLQETPEHDRLWFEQRPPRDFDFDD